MPMLKDHMVPWFEEMHAGMGFIGKQGTVEPTHAAFSHIEQWYTNMTENVMRMKRLMTEHMLRHKKRN